MLQWSPGLVAGETSITRTPASRTTSLQWSPGLVAGETWKATRRQHLPRKGLQWSPGLVAGETCEPEVSEQRGRLASMEPRLGRRGNLPFRTPFRDSFGRFNGAPAWSPGKPPDAPDLEAGVLRFNGAPAWSPGKRAHSLTTAADVSRFNGAPAWSPGKLLYVRADQPLRDGFNGAPAWSPGKR